MSHRDRINGGVLAAGDLADLCGCSRVGGASAVRTEYRDIGRSAVSDLFYRFVDDGCPGVLRQAERECGGEGGSEAGPGNGGR